MPRVQDIADPNYVARQYRDSTNLNARIRLHHEFSINKYGWQRWLFDQMKLVPNNQVLELGCGAGDLWLENMDRIPAGLRVILSDISAGMLAQAQRNLKSCCSTFQFSVIDTQSIPFDKSRFDVVIANHMLFHLPNKPLALAEIHRVLNPEGHFYSSTAGSNHLKELRDLVIRFDPYLASWGKLPYDSFTLENGFDQLGVYFSSVSLYRYQDALIVTDVNLMIDYILSGRIKLSPDQQLSLARLVKKEVEGNDGRFYITKDSGVFESRDTKRPLS